jgi:hypothetical protein
MHYLASGVNWVTGVNECKNKILIYICISVNIMSTMIIKVAYLDFFFLQNMKVDHILRKTAAQNVSNSTDFIL